MAETPIDISSKLRLNALDPQIDATKAPALMRETLAFWRDLQVFRFTYGSAAYLDLVRVSSGTVPNFKDWAIGDGFEKAVLAHRTFSTDEGCFYVHTLYVNEKVRGMGLGGRLLGAVVSEIRLLNRKPSIWLCANPKQPYELDRLYRFYEKRGFRRLRPDSYLMYFDNDFQLHRKVDPTTVDAVHYLDESTVPPRKAGPPILGEVVMGEALPKATCIPVGPAGVDCGMANP